MRRLSRSTTQGALVLALTSSVACSSPRQSTQASASTSAAPATSVAASEAPPNSGDPPWLGIAKSANEVAKVINASGNDVYKGPTGTVRGTVTVTGDPPPDVPFHAERQCGGAKGYYDRLFRKADNGAVADAVVAVTGFKGFVPVDTPVKRVVISDCSFGSRSFVLTYGQRIEVSNADQKESFIPYLDGTVEQARLVAMPQGNAVKLYPDKPGPYLLRDMMKHPFMLAHVFVFPYRTADVTGPDGHFEIKGVPVGKVTVTALLPMINKRAVEKELDVHEGDNNIDIELTYDKANDKPVVIPDATSPIGPK